MWFPVRHITLIMLIAIGAILPLSAQVIQKNISVEEADQLISDSAATGNLVILDVRTPKEFAKNHLKGAINFDLWSNNFVDSIATLNIKRTYLLYCTSGVRSGKAMKKMGRLGFEKLLNLKGGIVAWRAAKLPLAY